MNENELILCLGILGCDIRSDWNAFHDRFEEYEAKLNELEAIAHSQDLIAKVRVEQVWLSQIRSDFEGGDYFDGRCFRDRSIFYAEGDLSHASNAVIKWAINTLDHPESSSIGPIIERSEKLNLI